MELLDIRSLDPALPSGLGLQFRPKEPASPTNVMPQLPCSADFGSDYSGGARLLGTGVSSSPDHCTMPGSPIAGLEDQLAASFGTHPAQGLANEEMLVDAPVSSSLQPLMQQGTQLPGMIVPPYQAALPGPACNNSTGWQPSSTNSHAPPFLQHAGACTAALPSGRLSHSGRGKCWQLCVCAHVTVTPGRPPHVTHGIHCAANQAAKGPVCTGRPVKAGHLLTRAVTRSACFTRLRCSTRRADVAGQGCVGPSF